MSPKVFLVLMTLIAVISDSMLHPFYPQYFATVLGVHDARHVGFYIAACSLTVLVTFPGWALLAKRRSVLQLLIGTQIATCVLSLACAATTSLAWFWVLSLCMMAFKASYLLIYPYLMSIEAKTQHLGTVSLLAFVVYFGNILAALSSGLVFELVDGQFLFVAMAAGDLLQIALCLWMARGEGLPSPNEAEPDETEPQLPVPSGFVYRLGAVMFVLYFAAYVGEPFFSAYWESISRIDNKLVSGAVFAIPGVAALLGVIVNARTQQRSGGFVGITPALVLAVGGLALQVTGLELAILTGRFVFGWALFQSMVRLDLLMFRVSSRDSYAVDFSKINTFQGLGVLCASFAAGALVSAAGPKATFVVAAVGFAAAALGYCAAFRKELWPRARSPRRAAERIVT